MQTLANEKEMTFIGGKAVFFAKNKEACFWPVGAPKQAIVNGEIVTTSAAPAFFSQHRWATDQPEYAAGMVRSAHFQQPAVVSLDPSCLPPEVQAIWGPLPIHAKRTLAMALINGEDPKVVAGLADGVPVAAAAVEDSTEHEALIVACPVCGLVADDADPVKAQTALLIHQRVMHPDWNG